MTLLDTCAEVLVADQVLVDLAETRHDHTAGQGEVDEQCSRAAGFSTTSHPPAKKLAPCCAAKVRRWISSAVPFRPK